MAVRNITRGTTFDISGKPDADTVAVLTQLATLTAELRTDHNALVAKLDLDAGVTDTTYASLTGISSPAVDTIVLS